MSSPPARGTMPSVSFDHRLQTSAAQQPTAAAEVPLPSAQCQQTMAARQMAVQMLEQPQQQAAVLRSISSSSRSGSRISCWRAEQTRMLRM